MNEDFREEMEICTIVGKSFDQVHVFYKKVNAGSHES